MSRYFCNFCFKSYSPDQFHCTHIYFYELSADKLQIIKETIVAYFDSNPLKGQTWSFQTPGFLGDNNDRKVLFLDSHVDLHPKLRQKLSVYSPDTRHFQPHLTTNKDSFCEYMDRYSLVKVADGLVEEILTIQATPQTN